MILLYLISLNWVLVTPSPRYSIENEIMGEPTVDCADSLVGLTFKTRKPFSGRVYVYGMAGDSKCSKAFVENQNQSRLSMHFKSGDCTMQRQRVSGQISGLISSLVVVVSFHGTFVTKADRAYKCICFFRSQKTLTNSIEMSPLGTTELLNTVPTPTCTYSIHTQTPDGPIVIMGTVGEKIYHVWQCDSSATGFLVHSCSVGDGRGERIDLIDVDGCAVDPAIQPDVFYEDENRAVVEVYGYKFSGASVLNYECVLEICRSNLECENLTPPKCDREQKEKSVFPQEALRRSRSIGQDMSHHNKRGQIEVAATLTMEDRMDPNTVTSANDLPTLNQQTNSTSSDFSRTVCLPAFSILFTIILFAFIFITSMIVVFYVARYQTYVVNPKT
ncbi:hypothetical protein RB195_025990 [Necator americanus]